MRRKGYLPLHSELGNVYYPGQEVEPGEKVAVRYVEYPWITCFETEGFLIREPRDKVL